MYRDVSVCTAAHPLHPRSVTKKCQVEQLTFAAVYTGACIDRRNTLRQHLKFECGLRVPIEITLSGTYSSATVVHLLCEDTVCRGFAVSVGNSLCLQQVQQKLYEVVMEI